MEDEVISISKEFYVNTQTNAFKNAAVKDAHAPNQSFTSHSKQTGQSLIDFLIYVGLVAFAIGGISYYAYASFAGSKTGDAVKATIAMAQDAQKLFASDANGYQDVSNTVLINNGAVPTKMVLGTAGITNQFGGAIDVAPASLYGTANSGVQFTVSGVPSDSCSGYVQGVQAWFRVVKIGGTTVKDDTSNTPFSAKQLGTACKATSRTSVDVTLVAGR